MFVESVISRACPDCVPFAPNLWQWYVHQKNHDLLPSEIAHCQNQLEVIKYLGLEVFSRNIYCNERDYWFGGLSDQVFDSVQEEVCRQTDGQDELMTKTYCTHSGKITELLRYSFDESTLVQEKYLVDDYSSQLSSLVAYVLDRKWHFVPERYAAQQDAYGNLNGREAAQVTAATKPRMVIPCHFWTFKEHHVVAGGDPHSFVEACQELCPSVPVELLTPGQRIVITDR